MLKIAFFDSKEYDRQSFEAANKDGEFDIRFFETRLTPNTYKLAEGSDVVCVFVNDDINSFVIDQLYAMGIKLIAYNNVDVEYAYGKVHVVRVPAYSPYAVAEHAVALLLTSIRRIHKAYIRTKDFNFSLEGMTGFDLHGKTVGVIGTGKIGRIFIDICRGFGMNVIAYDKFPAADSTDENRHMINASTIAQMKKGVVIINTSRGALIDTEALVEGIKDRKIGAACLDVYEEESNIFFHDYSNHIVNDDVLARLISMPNVIVTSHQAFLTREALSNIADTTLANIREFFSSDRCSNEVCYKCGKIAEVI